MIGFYAAGAMSQGGPAPPIGFPNLLSTTTGESGSSTSHSVDLPVTANGDLLVLVIGRSGSNTTISLPSPWADAVTAANAGPDCRCFYLECDGSESESSVTISLGGSRNVIWTLYRIQAGTWSEAPEATRSTGNSASPDPPNLAPSWGSAKCFWIAAFGGTNTRTVSSYPLANGNWAAARSSFTTAACWSLDDLSSLNPAAFSTSASGGMAAITVAVRGG